MGSIKTTIILLVLAASVCSAQTPVIGSSGGGSSSGVNIVAPIQPQNKYILRSTYVKIAKMHTSSPQQLTVLNFGDSIAGNPWGSYINGDTDNIATRLVYMMGDDGTCFQGAVAANGTITHSTALGTGATAIDYNIWMTGGFYEVPVNGTITFQRSGSYQKASKLTIYYIKEPGAGHFKVESNNNGGGWVTEIADIDASNATRIGAVWTVTKGVTGLYQLRVTGISGGNVKLVGGGMIDTLDNGYISCSINVGGLLLSDANTTPSAITAPILQDIHPDLVTYSMREQTTPLYPDGKTFGQEIATLRNTMLAGNSLMDFLWFGASPQGGGHDDNDQIAQNTILAQQAATNGDVYWDGYYPTKNYATQVALGVMDDPAGSGVHINPTGHVFFQNQIWKDLGFGSFFSLPNPRDVNAPVQVQTPTLIFNAELTHVGLVTAVSGTWPVKFRIDGGIGFEYADGTPIMCVGRTTTLCSSYAGIRVTPGVIDQVNTYKVTNTGGALGQWVADSSGHVSLYFDSAAGQGAGTMWFRNAGANIWQFGTFLSGVGGNTFGLRDSANGKSPILVDVGAPDQAIHITAGGVTGTSYFVAKSLGNATAATIAAGAAAGTSPTVACVTGHTCSSTNGTLSVTTGSSTTTGVLLTITDSFTHSKFPDCQAQIGLTASPYTNIGNYQFTYSTTVWTLNVGTALTPSTAYTITYHCLGY